MISRSFKSNIERLFDKKYTKADLEKGMKGLVKNFIKQHKQLCQDEGVSDYEIGLAYANSMIKGALQQLVSIPFASQKLFDAFRNDLPENTRIILDELVWTERLSHKEIEDGFGIIIYDEEEVAYNSTYSRKTHQLKKEFEFFKSTGSGYGFSYSEPNYTLYLDTEFRQILNRYYDKPAAAYFNPVAAIEKTDHVYSGETDILLELSRVIAYAGQQQIKTTTKGKVQASTLSKMQRKLNTKEFYPNNKDKNLKYLRTGLLAALITTLKKPVVTEQIVRQLGLLIQSNYRNQFSSLQGIVTYLKGTGYVDAYYLKNVEPVLFGLIKNLPTEKWVSTYNLESYIKYNSYDIKFISESAAGHSLYYSYTEENGGYTYKDKHYVKSARYYRSLLLPFIKGTCFLFGAYGLLDLAYDTPDTSEMGKTAQSPYDSLKYIRLNKLGAFVLAKTAAYEEPTVISKSSITLSTDSLTIVVDTEDTTAPVILEPYTKRVSPNRFRTDFGFFLKDTKNKKELDDKISLFKQSVKVDIPDNWEVFFKELRQKIDPLTPVKDIFVFQIPTDNPELLRLIAKDVTLRKYCLKAEGYHIIVLKKNMSRFRKRLGEFGYLLP